MFNHQTQARADGKPRVLICDGFGSHKTLEILEFCLTNNIILCRLPFYTSHKLQPCDVGPVAPLETAYRDQVKRLSRGGVDVVGKEHVTYSYSPARERALTQRSIRSGWAATGLYPFNPDRVLRDIPKPQVEIVVPGAATMTSNTQDTTPQPLMTPVTPVTAEAVTSLHDMIKQARYLCPTKRKCGHRNSQMLLKVHSLSEFS